MTGADSFEIRTLVDTSYEKLVNAMFDSLQQTAKLDGEGEDKGQLNYHIILIGNNKIIPSIALNLTCHQRICILLSTT
jgi:hypothetical protein